MRIEPSKESSFLPQEFDTNYMEGMSGKDKIFHLLIRYLFIFVFLFNNGAMPRVHGEVPTSNVSWVIFLSTVRVVNTSK
jgi:F0F1-type ATP synthase membrane subunit a